MTETLILITGITGNQGGAVAKHLMGKGFKLRGLTRKPESDKARALAAKGVEIVKGDLNDAASVKASLKGVWGAFAVQNTWEAGVEGEETQGHEFAKLAKAAGVKHFVYTSVGSAERKTGIPHFENKYRVENTVRGLGFESYVILRPVFFMENLPSPWFLNGDKLGTAMKPDTRLQMTSVDDIGRVGARAFLDAAKLNKREIEIAGDSVSMAEVAARFSQVMGKKIDFVQYPIEAVRSNSEDFAKMLLWFEAVGYGAKIDALDKEFGKMTRFNDWSAKLGK